MDILSLPFVGSLQLLSDKGLVFFHVYAKILVVFSQKRELRELVPEINFWNSLEQHRDDLPAEAVVNSLSLNQRCLESSQLARKVVKRTLDRLAAHDVNLQEFWH